MSIKRLYTWSPRLREPRYWKGNKGSGMIGYDKIKRDPIHTYHMYAPSLVCPYFVLVPRLVIFIRESLALTPLFIKPLTPTNSIYKYLCPWHWHSIYCRNPFRSAYILPITCPRSLWESSRASRGELGSLAVVDTTGLLHRVTPSRVVFSMSPAKSQSAPCLYTLVASEPLWSKAWGPAKDFSW